MRWPTETSIAAESAMTCFCASAVTIQRQEFRRCRTSVHSAGNKNTTPPGKIYSKSEPGKRHSFPRHSFVTSARYRANKGGRKGEMDEAKSDADILTPG